MREKLFLQHILDCISNIEICMQEGKEVFVESIDFKTRDAILHNLQLLAESTKKISEERKKRHPEVSWKRIVNFRNIIVHEYMGLDRNLVWSIMEWELPVLKEAVINLLEAE